MRASYDSIDNKQIMCGKVNFSTSLIVLSNRCILYSVYCIIYYSRTRGPLLTAELDYPRF